MSDGGIDGGKYCRHRPPSSVLRPPSSVDIDNVFDCGGTPSSSNRGHRCRGLVVSLSLSSSCSGAPLDPDSNNDEDDDDRSRHDHATGSCNGNVGAPSGDVDDHDDKLRQRLQAGLRQ